MPTNRPRRHSLSSGDESFHPHPAKADGLPRLGSRRRAHLPRSKSASNVFDAFNRPPAAASRDAGNVALEQADIVTVRELATLLRTTGPPPDRPITHDECLRFSGSGEPKRWSLQSLRRGRRMKLQRHSLQSYPIESAIPGTTAEGHRYLAISTPAPKNTPFSGPWFRPQYPVFLPEPQTPQQRPHSSPRTWPERSSSKAAPFSNSEKGTAPCDSRNSPRLTAQSTSREHSPQVRVMERSRSGTLSNRVSTGHLLRAMLSPMHEESGQDLNASLKKLGSQRVPGMEQAQALPLVAVDEEETDQGDAPRQATLNRPILQAKPSQQEARGQSPPSSPSIQGPPRSPARSPRPPANILVQGGLVVPKENLPPESPGFPNMLATITFPSPPKGSQPSSPTSPTSSIMDSQASSGFHPAVQRRCSSRRARASSPVSGLSLDEIVTQKRTRSRRMKLAKPSETRTVPDSPLNMVKEPSKSRLSMAHTHRPGSPGYMNPRNTDAVSTSGPSSPKPSGEESITLPMGDKEDYQQESLVSQPTTTTQSSPRSVLTYNSSRSSPTSEMSAESEATITSRKTDVNATHTLGHATPPASGGRTGVDGAGIKTDVTNRDRMGLADKSDIDVDDQTEEPKQPRLWLSTVSNSNADTLSRPKGIIERRLARRAKVREYKMRDVDASRTDVVDSPILGYFASDLPPGGGSGAPGPSNSTSGLRRPSTLSMATTTSEASNQPLQNADDSEPPACSYCGSHLERDLGQTEAAMKVSSSQIVQLTLSAVVSTDIEPIYPKTADWQTSGIALSPIMVVANVESQPGSPTLRFSTPARPESSSPRLIGRLKPLKISPHTRHKSHTVTISRNPSTGAIERSASGPTDHRFNRRSLFTMPTPPMSPEVTRSTKRLSLPPVQLCVPVAPRDRTPPLRRQEWSPLDVDEPGPESRVRSATLKERVMREKLQKEKEITDIVAKTVGPPQRQSVYEDELDRSPLEQNTADTLEKRLERLERNNDAWLCAMKPLFETMARTLDDMRADDRCGSLRMSDFVMDMEVDAKRVTHSRRGEKETPMSKMQNTGRLELADMGSNNALEKFSSTPLSPVLQELDDSLDSENQTGLTVSGGRSPAGETVADPTAGRDMAGFANSPAPEATQSSCASGSL